MGWGEAARIRTSGPRRFLDAERAWRRLVAGAVVRDDVGLRGTGPVAFGSFAFADGSATPSALVVPSTVVGHREGRWWLTRTTLGGAETGPGTTLPGPLDQAPPRQPVPPPAGPVVFSDGAVGSPDWELLVGRAVARVERGELDKVVLARDLVARAGSRWTRAPCCAAWPRRTPRRGRSAWTACSARPRRCSCAPRSAWSPPGCWPARSAAPATTPTTWPWRPRSPAPARTSASTSTRCAASWRRSTPFCAGTNVPESPFVLHLANVMHLATDVTGVLRDDVSSLRLAAALHPSAAVCGTPTAAAAALIDEVEQIDRGRYAGPVGWIDASGDGEWGIALRCGQVGEDPREIRLFAGCGIVAGSDPAAELAESAAKFVPMRDALGG